MPINDPVTNYLGRPTTVHYVNYTISRQKRVYVPAWVLTNALCSISQTTKWLGKTSVQQQSHIKSSQNQS